MFLRLGAVATLVVAVAALVLGNPSGTPAYAQQQPEEFPVPGGYFYTQTRGSYPPGYGFAVVDDGVQFYTALRQLGGPAVAGYPISQRFITNGRVAQAFQRVILIWDPTTGQAIIQQTGTNLSVIPSEALVPAPWLGLSGPSLPPGGQVPPIAPGSGQAPSGQPFGVPYGQPYGQPYGVPYGQPYGQPYGVPYGQPYGYGYPYWYGYPYGYGWGAPYYDPFAPAAPPCDPILYPWGCPVVPYSPPPTPTNTPVPGPPACSGDNTEMYFEPRHPAVGQRTLIRVTSSYGWEDVGLSGPWNPRFEGLGPGGLNWVWTWSVTPASPGTFQYTFTINSGSGCITSGFSTQGTTPPATATPVPPHNTATATPVPPHNTATATPVHSGSSAPPAQQPPAHNPPAQQPPAQPTATRTATPVHPTATRTATPAHHP
jgi:hypothetical protein